ncbi:WecB/TagA/CpsF family glycosyltransferase [Mucilaginibacter aquatilis]|uniref:WecB/TagA/CpsF family glycosyltransferase n=1 Tax=Mucilaginibacter aquatilis TaxID=1517760 RepID=A0A6I4I654_9SPHI|nr:WecB/TagA/CpsF family glycosyltransferase [Mucilaginibacter aquatilis]MVN90610.1 WecB/TagA/CpsF family glycosyltransferase [Mucilaginibacter aquatilis]
MEQIEDAEKFLDYPLYTKSLNDLPLKSSLLVNTINQYSFCMANEDMGFKESLQMSDVLLPDGIMVVAAEYVMTGKVIKKISGADLHRHLLEDLNAKGGSCFYLGSSQQTLEKIKNRMAKEYPNVRVGVYSPPFAKTFTEEENDEIINSINEFKPDVLFVGMTAPKQEKWSYANKDRIDAKMICTVGAVFDFYAGTIKRPSNIMIDLGLEWLGRLVKEPKRLWKRYLVYGPVFVWLIAKERVKKSIFGIFFSHAI